MDKKEIKNEPAVTTVKTNSGVEKNGSDYQLGREFSRMKGKFGARKIILFGIILLVLCSSIFGAVSGFLTVKYFSNADNPEGKNVEKISRIIEDKESAVVSAVEKANASVVSIVVTKDVPKFRSLFDDPLGFGPFFSPFGGGGDESGSTEKQEVGGGSGFIVSKDGIVVTNKHVVNDSEAEYTVITSDSQEYEATIIARHPTLDIAMLKIKGDNFSPIDMGDSDGLKVGESVIAIGNPLGEFSNSVSLGIISGLKRDIVAGSGYGSEAEKLTGIIQTDAAINPGNSGGPLLDINGEVIGVNVAVAQGAENIGFALPVNLVKRTLEQIDRDGKISVAFLGVRYVIINKEIQKENNLPFSHGALVVRGEKFSDLAVSPASPADKAGIVENDIILEIEGEKITEKKTLADIVAEHQVGDEIKIKLWRKGENKELQVKLEEKK